MEGKVLGSEVSQRNRCIQGEHCNSPHPNPRGSGFFCFPRRLALAEAGEAAHALTPAHAHVPQLLKTDLPGSLNSSLERVLLGAEWGV